MADPQPDRYIIEHPTRGVLVSLDELAPFEWKARWSPTAHRSDAAVFVTLPVVRLALSRLPDVGRQQKDARVRRYGSWTVVP